MSAATTAAVEELLTIAAAAEHYVDAAGKLSNVERVELTDIVEADAALHDLKLALHRECGCEEGSCPGAIY